MTRGLARRTLLLLAVVGYCVALLVPTLLGGRVPSWYPFERTINLGLDLRGGAHLVYGIDLDQAVADRAATIARELEVRLAERGITADVTTPRGAPGEIRIVPASPAIAAEAREAQGDTLEAFDCPGAVCLRISASYAEQIRKSALTSSVEIIRERMDAKGVAEPSVVEKGEQIIVELPGLSGDLVAETRSVIARAAKLEMKVVDDGSDFMRRVFQHVHGNPQDGVFADIDVWRSPATGEQHADPYLAAYDRAVLERYFSDLAASDPAFRVPDDRQLAYEQVQPSPDARDPRPYWRSYYLEAATELTGAAISEVTPAFDPVTNRPIVLITLTREGGRVFGELTTRIVGEKLATLLDGRMRSAPIINEPIRGGRASISMGGGAAKQQESERDEMVNVLRTGSLPAPLREESAAQIGPTLGQDAIERAKLAFVVGIVAVVILLVGVYRMSGLIALATLTLNVVFVLALLVAFDATLTLPGIAGIVLTFGMSVDGNIIIFERIREELERNRSIRGAVDTGYSRAFGAIIDGQLTTMAGGVVLLAYGTGPITGFAVTLLIGNVTALFANIWCTRVLYDHYLRSIHRRGKPLSI